MSLKTLFDGIIKPIQRYGSEVWGILRGSGDIIYMYMLHLSPSATNVAVLGELSQLPIHLFWKEKMLKY